MSETMERLFGDGSDLDALQMALRAAAVFVLTLAMIRASGRRSFGQLSAFDGCTTVLLGSVLSRAVVGASPFWATMCAGLVIVVLHRILAMISQWSSGFERFVTGDKRELVRDGRVDEVEMRKALVTRRDLDEAIREKTGDERSAIARAVLERGGRISVEVEPSPRKHA